MGLFHKSKSKKSTGMMSKTRVTTRNRLHDIQTEYTDKDADRIEVKALITENGALQFVTTGRWISLNFIMSKPHWTKDSGIQEKVRDKVRAAVAGFDIKLESFYIILRYNSRLDDHNTVMMPKYFTDSIKHNWAKTKNGRIIADANGDRVVEYAGIIKEDDKSISHGTLLMVDQSLPHNTYIMTYVPKELLQKEIESIWKASK